MFESTDPIVRGVGKALRGASETIANEPLPGRWLALLQRLGREEVKPSRRALAEKHLALAERHVREAQVRISNQRERIVRLATDGHETGLAMALLETMLVTFEHMVRHRDYLRKSRDARAVGFNSGRVLTL